MVEIIKYEEYLRSVVKWHCNKSKRRERWKLRVCRLRFRNNVPFCMISKRKKNSLNIQTFPINYKLEGKVINPEEIRRGTSENIGYYVRVDMKHKMIGEFQMEKSDNLCRDVGARQIRGGQETNLDHS